jgi:hypothetical protein
LLDHVRNRILRRDDPSFDGFNTHDLRDFATFYLALGLGLLVAARALGRRGARPLQL